MLNTLHKWAVITVTAGMIGKFFFTAFLLGSYNLFFAAAFAYVFVRVVFSLIGDDQL